MIYCTVTAKSTSAKVELITYRELASQLIDGHSYLRNLMYECENNERYPKGLYIEHNIGADATGESIKGFEFIENWLLDIDSNQLTILGDVGTGKSFLLRMVAYNLAKDYLRLPLEKPLPILIDLRNADREFTLEGLISTHFAKNSLSRTSFDVFMYLLSQGYIVLLLDGFDEMAA
jgi:hypothetical protein